MYGLGGILSLRVSAGSVLRCVRACLFGLSVIRKHCPGWGAVIMSVTSGGFALHTQPSCPTSFSL